MKNIALIFAGGTGKRMGSDIPKQFLEIAGKEIIVRTLEIFQNNEFIDEIYVVSIESGINHVQELVQKYNLDKVVKILPGGNTGQDSIFIGLEAIHQNNENAIVLIHDGVRPLVDNDVVTRCLESVANYGSAITVTPAFETPIESEDGKFVSKMPARSNMFTAQAPQCFYLNDIYNIHLIERQTNPNYKGIVDSCGLMFKHGINCHLVEGNKDNVKVTTTENLIQLVGYFNMRDYSQIIHIRSKTKEKGGKK